MRLIDFSETTAHAADAAQSILKRYLKVLLLVGVLVLNVIISSGNKSAYCVVEISTEVSMLTS